MCSQCVRGLDFLFMLNAGKKGDKGEESTEAGSVDAPTNGGTQQE